MKHWRVLALALVVALMAAACGATTPGGAAPSTPETTDAPASSEPTDGTEGSGGGEAPAVENGVGVSDTEPTSHGS